MTSPPLSAMQTMAVHHGETPPPIAVDLSHVVFGERMMQGTYALQNMLDRDALASIAGYAEVFQCVDPEAKWHGYWYGYHESHGGGMGTAPQPTREAALAQVEGSMRSAHAFWRSYVETARRNGDRTDKGERIVRADGTHYVIGPEPAPGGYRDGLGFGGRRWEFVMTSGLHVVSHNVWYQGVIPVEYADALPDNATLAVTFGPAETRAGHKARKGYTFSTGCGEGEVVEDPTAVEMEEQRRAWGAL